MRFCFSFKGTTSPYVNTAVKGGLCETSTIWLLLVPTSHHNITMLLWSLLASAYTGLYIHCPLNTRLRKHRWDNRWAVSAEACCKILYTDVLAEMIRFNRPKLTVLFSPLIQAIYNYVKCICKLCLTPKSLL